MLPLLSLAAPSVYPRLTNEACPRGATPRRSVTLFFRGAHGISDGAQAVRTKLYDLKWLEDESKAQSAEAGGGTAARPIRADIKFTRGAPLSSGGEAKHGEGVHTKEFLKAVSWAKDYRLPYNVDAYARGMLHSDFCLLPVRALAPSTARRATPPSRPSALAPRVAHLV